MTDDPFAIRPALTGDARATELGWNRWRIFAAVWVAYTASRIVLLLMVKAAQPNVPPTVSVRLSMALLDGALVAACALVLLAAVERLPVEKPHRVRNAAVHMLLAFACSFLTLSVLFGVGRLYSRPAGGEGIVVFNVVSVGNTLFAFLAITAALQAALYQRRYRDREVDALRLGSQLTAARLESLRAKLHPHFLFNTLNGISDLIYTDPRKADAALLRLARLLRASLDTVDDEISVRQELDMLSTYFEIERMRFGERLRVTIDADGAASDARVPPFLVQPLAENAIQHGIAPRASGGAVTVRARVRTDPRTSTLVLELADDGVGMPAEPREGVGLRITRQRLEALYRGAGALTVLRRPGGGTIATIELPFATVAR